MKTKAIVTILGIMAALIALALPASAAAAKTYHQPAHVSAELGGTGTNGFHFVLFAFERAVIFATYRPTGQSDQSVSYVAFHRHPATGLDRGRLDVKIGKLGHFRGHFVADSTKTQKLEAGCTGEPTISEVGRFVGSFVFHGERGYTAIHAPRLNGSITRQGATDCRIPAGSHRHQGKGIEEKAESAAEEDEFRLLAGDRKADVVLQATRQQVPPGPEGGATTSFVVSATGGRTGAFTISRSAFVFDTAKDAASTLVTPNLAEPLAEATVEPPAPFSGSATFHLEGPKTASWTGDLAVELPGLGKLPLTGRKIYAGTCKGRSNCTETLPGLLGELIEGGGDASLIAVSEATVQNVS
jgi:hypothetical protein